MTRKKFTTDIFVSYATEDLGFGVSDIFMALYEIGIISSWIDRLMIKPGDSIPNKIDEGLSSTLYLLPIITRTYFNKAWTRIELDSVRMLSKPAIPIWIDVTSKEVSKFSPILASQKAIIYESNPYEIAEQIGKVLLADKRTNFFANKDFREESKIFWSSCYLEILYIISGKNIDDLWTGKLAEPDSTGATIRGNIENALDLTHDEMLNLAKLYQKEAKKLGNEITNEDIAHLICGEIKRRKEWFPLEPKEHYALTKIGLDRF